MIYIILTIGALLFARAYRNLKRIERNYKQAMIKVCKDDRIVYFQGELMESGTVAEVLPDYVQVLTDDKHLVYVERSKVTAVCLN